MKLGICVVYLVKNSASERLWKIHHDFIQRNTTVPYQIYGLINPGRISKKFAKRIETISDTKVVKYNRPNIRQFMPDQPARLVVMEHSYFLDELTKIALGDGCTHISIFHMDSFPVVKGWADTLIQRLKGRCVLSAIQRPEDNDMKPHSSFMIFTADFREKYYPTFNLQFPAFSSPDYLEYVKQNDGKILIDSGVGYGLKLWQEGLEWHPLRRTNVHQDHHVMGGVYGDMIFHAGGLVRPIVQPDFRRAEGKIRHQLYKDPVKYIDKLRKS